MNNLTQAKIQEELLKELGLENLPQEKQEELLIKMTEVLLKRIFARTTEKLSDADLEIYEKMANEKVEPEKMSEFLKEKIANYDEMVQKIIADFKEAMKKEI